MRSTALILLALAVPVLAQQRGGGGPPRGGGPGGGGPGGGVEKIRTMPESERKRTLEQLPPERRKQAETRLDHLNAMTPEERHALEQRYAAFQRLPLALQQHARMLFRQMNELKDDRRGSVQLAMGEMRALPASQREGFLKSAETKSKYDKSQRAVLEKYRTLLDELPADFTGFDSPAAKPAAPAKK